MTKQGLTSDQAAALILSEGKTSDPILASTMDNAARTMEEYNRRRAETLRLDAQQRAALTQMMGFEFRVKFSGNKILVSARDTPKLRTSTRIQEGEMDRYGNVTSEDLIDRLVDACLRLKIKWEQANATLPDA